MAEEGTMKRMGWIVGSLLVGAALACSGSEEPPKPSGPPLATTPAPASARPESHAPAIAQVRLEPGEPLPGGRVRAVVEASGPDGGSLRLRYAWTVDGAPVGGDTPEITLDQGRKGQEVEVRVVASDGSSESAPMRASGVLGNRPPLMLGVVLEPKDGLQVGGVVKAVPDVKDPDDDVLQFEVTWLVNGQAISEHGLELATKGLHRGDRIQAELLASDGKVTTQPAKSQELQIGNSAPKIVSRPETRFEEGVFHYTVEAKDPDGDRSLHYSLASAPEGMTIDRTGGEIRWQPTVEQAGKHAVEVVVEDAQGGQDVQTFELTIGTAPGKSLQAPVPAAPAQE
jgi:hypothetical protein